eukprot:6457110-Amphidinium_carterae.1
MLPRPVQPGGVKAPVHLGHLGLPRSWEMALPISLKVGIVQRCREHGAHTVPRDCCQSVPLLQANRAEHPSLNEIEPVFLVAADGPTRRPIPELRCFVWTVAKPPLE